MPSLPVAVMDQAKPTSPGLPAPAGRSAEAHLTATWPRCVQLALAMLLTLGIGFLLGRSFTSDRPSSIADRTLAAETAHPRFDLNRVSRAELALLPGIGPTRARSVDEYRRQHGPFRTVEELRLVPGVGPKSLEKLQTWLFIDDMAVEGAARAELRREPATKAVPTTPAKSGKLANLTSPINVNAANAAELQKLPGIGAKMAQRILDERTLRGPFRSVSELRRVSGIGAKTLERLRPHVIVDPPVAVAGS